MKPYKDKLLNKTFLSYNEYGKRYRLTYESKAINGLTMTYAEIVLEPNFKGLWNQHYNKYLNSKPKTQDDNPFTFTFGTTHLTP